MGSWCAENLRDAKAWSDQKLPINVSSDQAAKLFDASIRQLVSWIDCKQLGGLESTMAQMHDAEPEFLMGRVFKLGLNALGTGRSIRTDLAFGKELDSLVLDAKNRGNSREQQHARAVQLFANGEMQSACVEWEKILAEHPNDLLALKLSHDAYFFQGDKYGKRNSIARVIDKWDKSWPCYSYLHGMFAFGLEECGLYAEAEKHARIGLEMQRQDCWSTHALAHCYEMASNFAEGIRFMESTEADWAPCTFLACHNYWHTALFYIEKGDYETALSLYDKKMAGRGAMLDMVDAASLLTRFNLDGIALGPERWEAVLDLIEPHIQDQVLAFNDAHISMVLSQLADNKRGKQLAAKHAECMDNFVRKASGDNARITRDLGKQICDSIVALNSYQNYAQSFDTLYPIRTQLYRIGGSDAQRDVFTQMLIHAGFRTVDDERERKTLEVIRERENYKPNSALAKRLLQRHREDGANSAAT